METSTHVHAGMQKLTVSPAQLIMRTVSQRILPPPDDVTYLGEPPHPAPATCAGRVTMGARGVRVAYQIKCVVIEVNGEKLRKN